MKPRVVCFLLVVLLVAVLSAFAQTVPEGVGQGWLGEFNHASRQLLALAEATPSEKFSWRPTPGVRSVSEVYMHVAVANYFLLRQAGIATPPEFKASAQTEKSVTEKAEVIKWLKSSQDLVRNSYPKAELKKPVKLFGRETTVESVFLRMLVHNNEHMGQSIAYARTMGVVPPWSQGGER